MKRKTNLDDKILVKVLLHLPLMSTELSVSIKKNIFAVLAFVTDYFIVVCQNIHFLTLLELFLL